MNLREYKIILKFASLTKQPKNKVIMTNKVKYIYSYAHYVFENGAVNNDETGAPKKMTDGFSYISGDKLRHCFAKTIANHLQEKGSKFFVSTGFDRTKSDGSKINEVIHDDMGCDVFGTMLVAKGANSVKRDSRISIPMAKSLVKSPICDDFNVRMPNNTKDTPMPYYTSYTTRDEYVVTARLDASKVGIVDGEDGKFTMVKNEDEINETVCLSMLATQYMDDLAKQSKLAVDNSSHWVFYILTNSKNVAHRDIRSLDDYNEMLEQCKRSEVVFYVEGGQNPFTGAKCEISTFDAYNKMCEYVETNGCQHFGC